MLTHLSIKNFALIDHLALEFEQGLNVISGETGAGKSLLFSALDLLMGGRGDGDWVRTGAEKADLCAHLDLSQLQQARDWLVEQDLLETTDQVSDQLNVKHACVIRRVIRKDGRSRAYINGVATGVNQLKQLGALVKKYHSQHQHAELTNTLMQLAWYDRIVGAQKHLVSLKQSHHKLRSAEQRLLQLRQALDTARSRRSFLEYQLQELATVLSDLPQLTQLEAELSQGRNIAQMGAVTSEISGLLHLNDCNCIDLISRARSLVEGVDLIKNKGCADELMTESTQASAEVVTIEDQLKTTRDFLAAAALNLQEAVDEIGRLSAWDQPEQATADIEERLGQIYQLARKHRVKPEELLVLKTSFEQELEADEALAEELSTLEEAMIPLRETYTKIAGQVSKVRHAGQAKFERQVMQGLSDLGLVQSRFQVQFLPAYQEAADQIAEHFYSSELGDERLEFLFSSNQGHALKALHKVASGGELSRLNLVLQTQEGKAVQARDAFVYLFDEIDVGVSAHVAQTMGEMIKEISQKAQVFCITHAADVASQADTHWLAEKASSGQKYTRANGAENSKVSPMVSSHWVELDESGRMKELSRLRGDAKLNQVLERENALPMAVCT